MPGKRKEKRKGHNLSKHHALGLPQWIETKHELLHRKKKFLLSHKRLMNLLNSKIIIEVIEHKRPAKKKKP
jgi:hypothetical protein